MPEFILDHGTAEGAKAFAALDYFTQGYVEAMFFTNTGDPDDGDLQNATFVELAPETLASILADCAKFQEVSSTLLDKAYALGESDPNCEYSATDVCEAQRQAGRDFWFTRNGHGVGFWSRNMGDVGDALAESAYLYHAAHVYRGDDGLVYVD